MKKIKSYVLILASGGIDSTACINFYKKLNFEIEVLFIDYGQPSNRKEHHAISLITKYYQVKLFTIKVSNIQKFKDGFIKGRNAFFMFTGLMNFSRKNGIISLGIHKGTNYYDCSEDFSIDLQKIFDKYSNETIKIGIPFLKFKKNEIFDYCLLENVPVNLTYSCELGLRQPCGKCLTCKDLIAIYDNKK